MAAWPHFTPSPPALHRVQMPFDAAGATAAGHKRTRLRARLAWQDCHSAIARELGNGEYEALMRGGGDDQARAVSTLVL